jgi:putative DNA primase/helicase
MPDCDGEIERLAAKLARARHEMALRIEDSDIRGQQAKWSMKSEDAGRRSSLVKLAMCEPPIADSGKEWDNNPWTMGVKNGVLDLRTGSCRPGLQEDRITKQIATIYDPSAVCPRWEKFIAEIFAENAHLITHVQKILGMCLTGDVREQYLFVFHGTGDNGKNVLLDTVMGLMGEYAKSAPPDLLTYKVFDAHPTEIADLCGARLVVASETEENKMLRVALVKNLTGDAILKGRFMRQDYFSFPRTHKLILVTNNRPIVRENSHAIWRRIRLMPFTVTVPSEKQDKELLAKLGDEWPGILNWLIAGCLAWQADGLGLPDEVKEAIAEYREEQDLLSNFIMQYCHYDEDAFTPEIEMFDEYTRWAQETHEKYPLSRNVFLTRMKQLPNVKHEHRGHEKGFVGININISTAGI